MVKAVGMKKQERWLLTEKEPDRRSYLRKTSG